MARQESDREDLLREATAYVERIAVVHPAQGMEVFVGFRPDGAASFYFGVEPVYQFNHRCELRRAYRGGQLIKAEQGRLVALDRRRSADQVQLVRHELTDEETGQLLNQASNDLRMLARALAAEACEIVGQVPPDADIAGRLRTWLAQLKEIVVARSPRAE